MNFLPMNFDLTYSFMLPILQWFAVKTHSWGWAIIGLTVLVRIIVYPFVQSSTVQMRKMSQLQPQMKVIQEKYKSDPEQLQKKLMEFYSKNKMNPAGGCLPMLVQLPILFALYAAFSGPPFMDKPIDITVKVVPQAEAAKVHRDEVSKITIPYVALDGTMAKMAMFPGDMTIVPGQTVDFGTRAVMGKVEGSLNCAWKVIPKGTKDANTIAAETEPTFHADFTKEGQYIVEAKVPGIAAHEPFLFVSSLGKISKGMELLQPKNWDVLFLIIAFGVTTYLSSLFSVSGSSTPDSEMTEQQLIQKQTMKMMPLTMTAMFCFIPLPAGVFLYFVVSNLFQVIQTWWLMKQPTHEIVSVLDDGDHPSDAGSGGAGVPRTKGTKEPKDTPSGRSKGPAAGKSADSSGGSPATISTSSGGSKERIAASGKSATVNVSDNRENAAVADDKRKTKKKKK